MVCRPDIKTETVDMGFEHQLPTYLLFHTLVLRTFSVDLNPKNQQRELIPSQKQNSVSVSCCILQLYWGPRGLVYGLPYAPRSGRWRCCLLHWFLGRTVNAFCWKGGRFGRLLFQLETSRRTLLLSFAVV